VRSAGWGVRSRESGVRSAECGVRSQESEDFRSQKKSVASEEVAHVVGKSVQPKASPRSIGYAVSFDPEPA